MGVISIGLPDPNALTECVAGHGVDMEVDRLAERPRIDSSKTALLNRWLKAPDSSGECPTISMFSTPEAYLSRCSGPYPGSWSRRRVDPAHRLGDGQVGDPATGYRPDPSPRGNALCTTMQGYAAY
jgi:hypothetical protein